MPELAVVMTAGVDRALSELVEAVCAELRLQGVDVSLGDRFAPPEADRVWCLVSPHGLSGDAVPGDPILRRTVVLASRTPPDGAERELLRRAGVVFALTPGAVTELGRLGVAARLLRPGWSAGLDHFDAAAPRPLEIAFTGAGSPRGDDWLVAARTVLAAHEICPVSAADPRLQRARLAVHVPPVAGMRLGWQPMLGAALSGAVLVTEPASDLEPFVPGEHLLVASGDALADVVAAALTDPERLSRIRAAAHKRARSWLPLALPVSFLRAAIVELLAVPTRG